MFLPQAEGWSSIVQYKIQFNHRGSRGRRKGILNASLRLLLGKPSRCIHLNLIVPDKQRTQSAGPIGCSRALLGFRVSELFFFFRKVLTYYDQACVTASDQNCSLRSPRLRCTIKLRQMSFPKLRTNESC